MWHNEWDPRTTPPQSITIALGRPRPVTKVTYQPRMDGNGNGVITEYVLEAGRDGRRFTRVAAGTWPQDMARKEIALPAEPVRYLRLTDVAGGGGFVSAAEIGVAVPAG